jgi:exoribonuclease-2
MKKNALALYKNELALVTETGEKITVVYEKKTGGEESLRVREKDVTLLHEGPAESLGASRAFDSYDNAQTRLAEAYELLSEEDGGNVTLEAIAELAFGEFTAKSAWAAYKAVKMSPFFVQTDGRVVSFALRRREEAEKIAQKEQGKEKEESARKEFVTRLKAKTLILPDDAQYMQEVEAFALGQTQKCRVLAEAGFALTSEKAHQILLDTGVWDIRKNPHPSRRGFSLRSASEPLGPPPDEPRVLVEHTALAIDSAWCDDPDDAVFFDGSHLWVHVADPAGFVTPDSKADISARNRGTTLYLPEGASRMLCEQSLADYALGLSEFSNALSFKIALDDEANILDCEVLKTRLKVRRYTYEQADQLRDSGEFAFLFALAEKNTARREKTGAVSVNLPETHIHAGEGGVSIMAVARNKSADVVREMMLLAGEAAARFAFKNNIAFPYACQQKPDFPSDIPSGLAGDFLRVRCMHSRVMSAIPSAHAGLGLSMYSQVTSPLRRYGDLVAHQQLRAFIDGKPLLNRDDVLERIARGDAASAAASKAERESNLHWTLVYLLENPAWTAEAVVVDVKGYAATVLIPSLAKQETIITAKKAALNDTLTVKAGKINLSGLSAQFMEA